jgi:hypothetical protein
VIEYPTWGGITYLILECFSWLVASEGSPGGVSATWGMLGPRVKSFTSDLVTIIFVVYLIYCKLV